MIKARSSGELHLPTPGRELALVRSQNLLRRPNTVHSQKSLAQMTARQADLLASKTGQWASPDFKKLRATASQALISQKKDGELAASLRRSTMEERLNQSSRTQRPHSAAGDMFSMNGTGSKRALVLKESRRQLAEMLTYKLQAKYCGGMLASTLSPNILSFRKQEIGRLVGTFVATSKGISEQDLVHLEKQIEYVIETSSPRKMSNNIEDFLQQQDRPSSSNFVEVLKKSGKLHNAESLPASLNNEWTLVDMYNTVKFEDEQQKILQKKQMDKLEQREVLKRQMEERQRKEQTEKQQEREYYQRQNLMVHAWEEEQKHEQERKQQKMLEERTQQQKQVHMKALEKTKQKAEERRQEEHELAVCKKELQQEMQLKQAALMAERQRMMKLLQQNERDELQRQNDLKKQAQEDVYLMELYTQKLNDEEYQRKAEFEKRVERYKVIGEYWENHGAGKKQREEELKLERKILSDAAKKEEQDALREEEERLARRNQLLQNIKENEMIVHQKKTRQKIEKQEDHEYAKNYRKQGEDYARETIERDKQRHAQLMDQRLALEAQIAEARKKRPDEMSATERKINANLLRKLTEDHEGLMKIQEKAGMGKGKMKNYTGLHTTFGRIGLQPSRLDT